MHSGDKVNTERRAEPRESQRNEARALMKGNWLKVSLGEFCYMNP